MLDASSVVPSAANRCHVYVTLSAIFVMPLLSAMRLMPAVSTAGTRNTFGAVMTRRARGGRVEAHAPDPDLEDGGVSVMLCMKAPVLLADRLWAAFPMLAPSRGVPSSWSEGLTSGRTTPEPCTTNQYSVDAASVTGVVGLNV